VLSSAGLLVRGPVLPAAARLVVFHNGRFNLHFKKELIPRLQRLGLPLMRSGLLDDGFPETNMMQFRFIWSEWLEMLERLHIQNSMESARLPSLFYIVDLLTSSKHLRCRCHTS